MYDLIEANLEDIKTYMDKNLSVNEVLYDRLSNFVALNENNL